MMPGGMAGVQPDQGPPLAVPLSFFAVAAVALVAAGVVVAGYGGVQFSQRTLPGAQAATHLLTLGFLGAVMLGALYQMIPVVGGAPVPAPQLAFVALAAWTVGVVGLVLGFLLGAPVFFSIGGTGLLLGATLAGGPLGVALFRSPARTPTLYGLRVAAAGFVIVVGAGLGMALLRAGLGVSLDWVAAWRTHVGLGAAVWVSGLIVSVSWQVLPMFYTAPAPYRGLSLATLAALALPLFGLPLVWGLGLDPELFAWLIVPTALAVWVVQPISWARQLQLRKRRRKDASVRFWAVASGLGPLVGLVWAAAAWREASWLAPLAGWLFFFGWAGLVVHGMLTRIVAFLVWFHRFSGQVGKAPVPPMKQLWPDRAAHRGLALHIVTLALGATALVTGYDWVTRATGVGLVLVGLSLGYGLWRALRKTA